MSCAEGEQWMERMEELVNLTHEEAYEARRKFPTSEKRFSALMEEVGEIAKAFNEDDCEGWRRECIQAAAMCLRLAAEGDPAYKVTQGESDVDFWANMSQLRTLQEGGGR